MQKEYKYTPFVTKSGQFLLIEKSDDFKFSQIYKKIGDNFKRSYRDTENLQLAKCTYRDPVL